MNSPNKTEADDVLVSIEMIQKALAYFNCRRSPQIQKFIKYNISQAQTMAQGRTYFLIDAISLKSLSTHNFDSANGEYDKLIMGFFTIGLASIDFAKFPGLSKSFLRSMFGRIPQEHQQTMAVYIIGELARSDYFSSNDIAGDTILNECVAIIKHAQSLVAGRCAVVNSREKVLETLYGPAGFKKLGESGKLLDDETPLISSCLKL